MLGVESFARAFERNARRRAAGKAAPAVLLGDDVVETWMSMLPPRTLVRAEGRLVDVVAAYLEDASLARVLAMRIHAARGGSVGDADLTRFERTLRDDVNADALLAAGEDDAHLLIAGSAPPLHAFGAAVRLLGDAAPALLLSGELDEVARVAIALAEVAPRLPIGIATTDIAWSAWRAMPGREHAKALLTAVGAHVQVEDLALDGARRLTTDTRPVPTREADEAARSAAERALFDALEAHPKSRGVFRLNETLTVRFGSRPLEIDLASTALRLAIEVDGYFHFQDADAYRRDRRKDVVLQQEGYFVLRVLADDVVARPDEVVAEIHEAIAFLTEERPQ